MSILPDFVVLAFVGAALFGLEPALSKRGLAAGGTWLQSTLILLFVRVVLFWSALLWVAGPSSAFAGLTPAAGALFAVASVIATALGRPALYEAFDRVGSTVSNAFVNARPVFSVGFGAVVLGELVSSALAVGVFLLVGGLVAVTLSKGGDIGGWSKTDLVFPLFAALAFSTGNVIRRFGFTNTSTTVLQAVTVGETVTCLVVVVYAVAGHPDPVWTASRRVYGYFLGGTVLASLGFLSMFAALNAGPVSVVDSVIAAAPLVTVVVAAIFLRDIERVTLRLIAGVVLVVAGLVLVTTQPF
ncbi:MAG: DMT family transporter [Halovenus sp.]